MAMFLLITASLWSELYIYVTLRDRAFTDMRLTFRELWRCSDVHVIYVSSQQGYVPDWFTGFLAVCHIYYVITKKVTHASKLVLFPAETMPNQWRRRWVEWRCVWRWVNAYRWGNPRPTSSWKDSRFTFWGFKHFFPQCYAHCSNTVGSAPDQHGFFIRILLTFQRLLTYKFLTPHC